MKRPSPAAAATRERNWRVFRLRGLHAQLSMLTGDRRDAARALVDDELASLGAKTEAQARAEREARWAREEQQ